MQIITKERKFGSEAEMRAFYAGVHQRLGKGPRPPIVRGVLLRPAPVARVAAPVPAEQIPGALRLTPAIIECLPPLCPSVAAVEDWLQAFATASGIPAETWRTATGPVQQDIRAMAAAGAVRIGGAIPARVMADLGLPQGVFDKASHQFPLYAAEIGAPMIAGSRGALAAHIHRKVGERRLTMEDVMRAVCAAFGVSPLDVVSDRRQRYIVRPRQIYYAACKVLTECSFPVIAFHCGDRDHTSVLHGVRKMERLLREGDNELFAQIGRVEARLGLGPRAIAERVLSLGDLT